jgi:hypothetical protein
MSHLVTAWSRGCTAHPATSLCCATQTPQSRSAACHRSWHGRSSACRCGLGTLCVLLDCDCLIARWPAWCCWPAHSAPPWRCLTHLTHVRPCSTLHTQVWADGHKKARGGGDFLTLWKLVPPAGYMAMGLLASVGAREPPSLNQVRLRVPPVQGCAARWLTRQLTRHRHMLEHSLTLAAVLPLPPPPRAAWSVLRAGALRAC